MKHRFRSINFMMVLIAFSATPLAAQREPLSPTEVATIKEEVTAAVHKYYRLFTERNMKAVAEQVFHRPSISVGANGVTVNTVDEVLARYEASLKQRLADGWDRSEFPNPKICVINRNAALASGVFYRYRKDGSVLSENGITYLYSRAEDGWRMVTMLGHTTDKVVQCND
jgi:hypothetical protein